MKKENMNNKGFSLVELIIVIAIMAILIVVLAPQYLRYVERSRNSTDMQNARTLMTAIETWAADPQASSSFGGDGSQVVLAVSPTGTTVTNPSGSTAGDDALTASGLVKTDIKCSSKTSWDTYTLTGTVTSSGGITWGYTSSVGGTDNNNFQNSMKGQTVAGGGAGGGGGTP